MEHAAHREQVEDARPERQCFRLTQEKSGAGMSGRLREHGSGGIDANNAGGEACQVPRREPGATAHIKNVPQRSVSESPPDPANKLGMHIGAPCGISLGRRFAAKRVDDAARHDPSLVRLLCRTPSSRGWHRRVGWSSAQGPDFSPATRTSEPIHHPQPETGQRSARDGSRAQRSPRCRRDAALAG